MKQQAWWGGVLACVVGASVVWAETGASTSTSPSSVVNASVNQATSSNYDFGNGTSETLVKKAWEALNSGDQAAVAVYTKKCIDLYQDKALEQAASVSTFASKEQAFSYWAMNDVGTAYFILGQSLLAQGKVREAQDAFNAIIQRVPYAQTWDPKGWFWKVADAANDKLATIGTTYDFGDYTSMTLTTKAWQALAKNDHRGIELYTKKCIELYEEDAKKQQAQLKGFAPKDQVHDYWALNDVGTCFFILGESLKTQKRYQEARAAFERVVNDFSFAQAWDERGWFWKVAVAARGKVTEILNAPKPAY